MKRWYIEMTGEQIQALPGYGRTWMVGRIYGRAPIHIMGVHDIYLPALCGITGTDGSGALDVWEVSSDISYQMCAQCLRLQDLKV